jgi:phage baseplate assembly protein W
MTTRVDFITQLTKQPDIFSDFIDDFSPHPVTGDIARLRNDQSVKQSIKNLVLTGLGERPFQPLVGSTVYTSLFEPDDFILAETIKFNIENTINNNEPRASLINVSVIPNDENNSISINIVFSLVNSQTPQILNLLLRRVR